MVWNSQYNRDSFVSAVRDLLDRCTFPVDRGWSDRLHARSSIAWPPVGPGLEGMLKPAALHNQRKSDYRDRGTGGREVVRVVWPHRWEHDKGCRELEQLIARCREDEAIDFRWSILGHRFREIPEEMVRIGEVHREVLEHFGGPVDRTRYLEVLRESDWVCSTARHEFFGIGVAEALLAGCLPWLPDRLSYPELVPPEHEGMTPWSTVADPGLVRRRIREHLVGSLPGAAVARIDDLVEGCEDPRLRSSPCQPDSTP